MICTFYSYKGGVGRSMALANVADVLARTGLRVLMIDFDLEAPGLEQYFPGQDLIRSNKGLFDLIASYKTAMSTDTLGRVQEHGFRRLHENFITPIYLQLPSGGKLDLMTAGRRDSDEQLSEYALKLRQFDWQDFYFNFGGEVFFEWLRRSVDRTHYDVVLVDSRTGVTEMGGICAYQLADVIVVMCAANQQNLDGTHAVVRNFFSPRVKMLRAGRPLQLLVIPSRVEVRDEDLLGNFRERFNEQFASFTPTELTGAGLSYWDLMIPYEPRSAFQERVPVHGSRASARSSISPAIEKIVQALTVIADADEPLKRLRLSQDFPEKGLPDPKYDITSRSAGYDAFLTYALPDKGAALAIAEVLTRSGLRIFFDPSSNDSFSKGHHHALLQSKACVIILGASDEYPWRSEFSRRSLEERAQAGQRLIPVLLQGAKLPTNEDLPSFLFGIQWIRLEDLETDVGTRLADAISLTADPRRMTEAGDDIAPPYKGLSPFLEIDAPLFFGRERLVEQLVRDLEDTRFVALIGPSGIGKTSVVFAGLVPALRRAAISGSEGWHIITVRPGIEPLRALFDAISTARVAPTPPSTEEMDAHLDHLMEQNSNRYLLIVDQLEELFTNELLTFSQRTQFIRALHDIASRRKDRFAVVIVMRSDYINAVMEFSRNWARLVEENIVFVGPMDESDMRRAIESPARQAGFAIEPGLTDIILKDLSEAAGALPLLQYVLRALWESSRQGYLTVDAYQSLGGIAGSLAKDADALFQTLPSENGELAMTILLRLVRVTQDGNFVKRRATINEFAGNAEEVRKVLDHLINGRLVVASSVGNDASFEVAHEAIITRWPRFRDRIEKMADLLRARTCLEYATLQWSEIGRPADLLYSERELALLHAHDLLRQINEELGPRERTFLEESERALSKNRLRTRWIRFAAATAVMLLFSFSALTYLVSKEATLQREIAVLRDQEARQASDAAVREASLARLLSLGASSAVSGNGRYLVRADTSGELSLVDLASGRVQATAATSSRVTTAVFSPDGQFAAVGASSGEVSIFNIPKFSPLTTLRGHSAQISRLAFSPDNSLLASGSDDFRTNIWSLATGALIRRFSSDSAVVDLAFSPNGLRLIVTSQAGTLYTIEPSTGNILSEVSGRNEPRVVNFSVCVGEFSQQCRAGNNTAWVPCGTDITNWARTNHPSECVNVKSQTLSSVSGNRCGYTTIQVTCSSQ